MSSSGDRFIDEVTEELRRDRLFGYIRRYGWIAILLILALVAGAAYTEWRRAAASASAAAAGDAIYAALSAAEPAARAEGLAGLDLAGPARAPAQMLRAATLIEAGEGGQAAEVLAALAADAALPRVWTDLAALKRLVLLGRELPPEERLAALGPLAVAGAPYRVLALEQQALAQIDAGDTAAALATLEALAADQQATAGLRSRAAQLMVALGGGADGA